MKNCARRCVPGQMDFIQRFPTSDGERSVRMSRKVRSIQITMRVIQKHIPISDETYMYHPSKWNRLNAYFLRFSTRFSSFERWKKVHELQMFQVMIFHNNMITHDQVIHITLLHPPKAENCKKNCR